MIPFHAFHPPVLQYRSPVEPLIWIVNPSSLDIDEKILAVLQILRGLRMTVMDLMLHSISKKAPCYLGEKLFFKARPLCSFSMCWMLMIIGEVDAEIEAAKDIFGMSSKDVTPELLLSIDLDALLTARLRETTPRGSFQSLLQLEVQHALQKVMI
ncbi:hypothetical protein BDR03DRAFT_940027 [Suillus americanus]|nr:hypothetical protein BDR03DRAFT_940027 [Suillus americanus]